ncbi:MAG: hypothetical protein ACOC2Y_00535 [Spirochaetota bacterium]
MSRSPRYRSVPAAHGAADIFDPTHPPERWSTGTTLSEFYEIR